MEKEKAKDKDFHKPQGMCCFMHRKYTSYSIPLSKNADKTPEDGDPVIRFWKHLCMTDDPGTIAVLRKRVIERQDIAEIPFKRAQEAVQMIVNHGTKPSVVADLLDVSKQ